jgi:hypothetical protein
MPPDAPTFDGLCLHSGWVSVTVAAGGYPDLSSVVRVEAIRPFPEKVISGGRGGGTETLHGGMEAGQRPGSTPPRHELTLRSRRRREREACPGNIRRQ